MDGLMCREMSVNFRAPHAGGLRSTGNMVYLDTTETGKYNHLGPEANCNFWPQSLRGVTSENMKGSICLTSSSFDDHHGDHGGQGSFGRIAIHQNWPAGHPYRDCRPEFWPL